MLPFCLQLVGGLAVLAVLAFWPLAVAYTMGDASHLTARPGEFGWVVGLVIGLAAVWAEAWTEDAEPTATGPYRRVRNPMALAGLLMGLAGAWWLVSPAVAAVTVFGAMLWHVLGEPRREARLLKRFGSAYAEYRHAVPLWLPTSLPYPPRLRIEGDGTTRVYYDGNCPFCRAQTRRLVGWCHSAVKRGELQAISFREERPDDLPLERCDQAMQCVQPDGRVREGLDGIVYALQRHSSQGWWAWLYRLPGGSWIADPIYAWVARHRPQDCSDDTCPIPPTVASTSPPGSPE